MPAFFKFLPFNDTNLGIMKHFWNTEFLENMKGRRIYDDFQFPTCERPERIPASAERNGYFLVRFYNRTERKRNRMQFLCRDGIWYRLDNVDYIDNRDVWNPPIDRGMKIMNGLLDVHHSFLNNEAIRVRNYHYGLTVGRNRTRRMKLERIRLIGR